MIAMANLNNEYLSELVTKFKAYKKPNETQQLIVLLGDKTNRTDEDNRKLTILLKAEKKAEQLAKARADARNLLNEEKAKVRKAEARKKIVWGGALKTASKKDAEVARLMRKLFDGGYVAERDKDAVREDLSDIAQATNQLSQQHNYTSS